MPLSGQGQLFTQREFVNFNSAMQLESADKSAASRLFGFPKYIKTETSGNPASSLPEVSVFMCMAEFFKK